MTCRNDRRRKYTRDEINFIKAMVNYEHSDQFIADECNANYHDGILVRTKGSIYTLRKSWERKKAAECAI